MAHLGERFEEIGTDAGSDTFEHLIRVYSPAKIATSRSRKKPGWIGWSLRRVLAAAVFASEDPAGKSGSETREGWCGLLQGLRLRGPDWDRPRQAHAVFSQKKDILLN